MFSQILEYNLAMTYDETKFKGQKFLGGTDSGDDNLPVLCLDSTGINKEGMVWLRLMP